MYIAHENKFSEFQNGDRNAVVGHIWWRHCSAPPLQVSHKITWVFRYVKGPNNSIQVKNSPNPRLQTGL